MKGYAVWVAFEIGTSTEGKMPSKLVSSIGLLGAQHWSINGGPHRPGLPQNELIERLHPYANIKPVRSLFYRFKEIKLTSEMPTFGMLPESILFDRFKYSNVRRLPSAEGIELYNAM